MEPTDLDARLDAATRTVLAEISRTDAKAGVLLTAFSLPLAALVAATPGRPLPGAAAVLAGTGVTGLATAMLVVLTVVRPRLGGARRGSFLYWSLCTEDELVEDLHSPKDGRPPHPPLPHRQTQIHRPAPRGRHHRSRTAHPRRRPPHRPDLTRPLKPPATSLTGPWPASPRRATGREPAF